MTFQRGRFIVRFLPGAGLAVAYWHGYVYLQMFFVQIEVEL